MKVPHAVLQIWLTVAVSLLAGSSLAQTPPAPDPSFVPPATPAGAPDVTPARMVRLSYVLGDVHVDGPGSAAAPQQVAQNMPLTEGSVLATGDQAQAEIEFEDGSVVRLTPNSAVSLLNLSVDSTGNFQSRLALLHGLAYLELRAGTRYLYSVDAGGYLISPLENATVRVNLDEPPASIAVLDGSARVTQQAGSGAGGPTRSIVDLAAGESLRATADLQVSKSISPESWDRWNEDRDLAAASQSGTQTDARNGYAGDQGYGWSDLDANGTWYNVPGQGDVWQPYAAQPDDSGDSGFDPYGYGSWVWSTGYGYTWASGYGWGWTPYRCGSWNYWNSFGWGWLPGQSCGVYGFGGYGYRLNVGHHPPIYHGPRKPIRTPGAIQPLVRVHGGTAPAFEGPTANGPRRIAGQFAQPLAPVGGGYTPRGGSALGSALRRDYPIDQSTHEPVVGVSSMRPSDGFRAPYISGGNPASTLRIVPGTPASGVPPARYSGSQPRYFDPNSTTVPTYHPSPQPAIRPYSPPPAPRPYSPPPAFHPAPAPAPAPRGK